MAVINLIMVIISLIAAWHIGRWWGILWDVMLFWRLVFAMTTK